MDLSDDCFQLNYNLLINWSVCKIPEKVISVFPTARGDLFCLFHWTGSPQPKEIQTPNPTFPSPCSNIFIKSCVLQGGEPHLIPACEALSLSRTPLSYPIMTLSLDDVQ